MIDGVELKRTRIRRGLSVRALSHLTGVGIARINDAETGGDTSRFSIGELTLLSQALEVDIAQLLHQASPLQQAPSPEATPGAAQDAKTLCALLANQGERPTSRIKITIVCEHLGWTLDRFNAALDALEPALYDAGLGIHRRSGEISLIAQTPIPEDTIKGILNDSRVSGSASIITPGAVKILYQIWTGRFDAATAREPVRRQLSQLQNAGLIEVNESGGTVMSPRVDLPIHR